MADAPGIRARWCKPLVEGLDGVSDEIRAAAVANVGAERIERIRNTSALAWLPMEDHLAVMDGLCRALGDTAWVAYHGEAAVSLFGSNLLRSMASAGYRLLGRAIMTKVFPSGFSNVVRGYGKIDVTQTEDQMETTITFSDMPPEPATSRGYQLSLKSTFEAMMAYVKIPGDVEMDLSGAAEGRLVYVMRAHE